MVSEWMPNGDINRFVEKHLDVNRFELVSFIAYVLCVTFLIDDWVIL